MRRLLQGFRNFIRNGDMLLLVLCLVTTAFGCLMISSATSGYSEGFARYLIVQIGATALGVLMYAFFSTIDAEFFTEHRLWLIVFNFILLLLLIPFGETINGNRSWLNFPFLPFNSQPAEICQITFILLMASVMNARQHRLSSPASIWHMVIQLLLLLVPNMLISEDLGVSMIFVFIFVGMTYSGGVNILWFLGAIGAVALAAPFVWPLLSENQQLRIQILFDPTIDPLGIGPRYHSMLSLKSLTGGGMTGQGLFQGIRTSNGVLFAQHTDYIFSAIGEELGYVGCVLVVVMLAAIVARCIWVGVRSSDYMRKLICFGAASALIFQVCSNVGMCIGVTPVIGLTLPFISYGGSSLVSLYAMMGLVSGVYARPAPASHERYIRPPYAMKTLR